MVYNDILNQPFHRNNRDKNNNFKKQINHVMNRVDNEVTINNWRPDLVI